MFAKQYCVFAISLCICLISTQAYAHRTLTEESSFSSYPELAERNSGAPVMTLFGAPVHLLRLTASELETYPELEGADELLLSRLQSLKPRIEAQASHLIGSRPGSFAIGIVVPVANVALAETNCHTGRISLGGTHRRLSAGKNCSILFDANEIAATPRLDFTIAHEVFHTIQSANYRAYSDKSEWWSEGSAEWFAHKVVPGTAVADGWIADFYSNHPNQPINQSTYDAQVFYFWAERHFDQSWVLEHGYSDDEYLATTAGAARSIGPDHWLEFAAALSRNEITKPDGGGLPNYPARQIEIQVPDECEDDPQAPVARLDASPLSVQSAEVTINGDTANKVITVDSGNAWARVFVGESVTDLEGGSASIPLNGLTALQIAAISPSENPLRISLAVKDREDFDAALGEAETTENSCGCDPLPTGVVIDQCIVGDWDYVSGGGKEWLEQLSALIPNVNFDSEVEEENATFCANGVFYYSSHENMVMTADDLRATTPEGLFTRGTGTFRAESGKFSFETNPATQSGRLVAGGTTVIPTNPSLPTDSGSGSYSCSATELTITVRVPDVPPMIPPITTTYRRILGRN